MKKTAAESYRLLREVYGKHAPSQDTCERWIRRFKSGDFEVPGKKHGKSPKTLEDAKLKALFNEDDSQTHNQLAEQLGVRQQVVSNRLREMGKIQTTGKWVPHELNDKKIIKHKNTCDICSLSTKVSSFCIVSYRR